MAAAPVASSTFQPTVERYVRLCPQHGTHLRVEMRRLPHRADPSEQLICPRDSSVVLSWAVWDRRHARLIGFGQPDRILMVEGECDDILDRPSHEGRKRVHRARKWER